MPDQKYGRHEELRVLPAFAILFATLYAAFGTLSPFFPAFLQSRQLQAGEIGFILGVGTAVRLVAGPVAGRVADFMQAHRVILLFAL